MHSTLRTALWTCLSLGLASAAQATPIDTLRFEPNPLRLEAGVPGDGFGRFVALDGPRYAIAAWNHQQAPSLIRGAAYLGHHDGLGWSAPLRFVFGDPGIPCHFAQNVALSGNTAVFGSYARNFACPSVGRVDVFDRDGSIWIPGTIAPPPNATNTFGVAVALDGDRLAIGDSGAQQVSIYQRQGGIFALMQQVPAPMLPTGSGFGNAIAISGDLLVVAAPYAQLNSISKGSVSIFRRNAGSGLYDLEYTEIMADGGAPTFLGEGGVATDGVHVVATASFYAIGSVGVFTPQPGAVIVYSHDGPNWAREVILPSEATTVRDFGSSADLDQGHLVVSAPIQQRIRIYAKGAGGWIETGHFEAPSGSAAHFGSNVSLDPGRASALVGADSASMPSSSGAAFLYETTMASVPDLILTVNPVEPPECAEFQPATVQVSWQSDGVACRVVGAGSLSSWRDSACPLPVAQCPDPANFRLLPPTGSLTIALVPEPSPVEKGEILSIECHDAQGRSSRVSRPLSTRSAGPGDCPAVTHGLAGALSGDPEPMADGTWAMRALISNPGGQSLIPIVRNHGQHGTVHLAIEGDELLIRYAPEAGASGVLTDSIAVAVGNGSRAVEASYGIALPITIHESGFE